MKHRKTRADGRYSINVSFTAHETSLIAWADKHGNFSNYVKKLIEADMKKGAGNDADIQGLLLNLLGKQGLNNIFQNNEVAVGVVETEPEKPKVNKSKIMGIMGKK